MSGLDLADPLALAAAAGIMFLGGLIKGAVGFALPMIAVAGIGSFLTAQDALALLILPVFMSNLWQTLRQGLRAAIETGRRFWKLNLILVALIAVIAQAVPEMSSRLLFLALGAIVSTAAALQLVGWRPLAPREPALRTVAELTAGTLGGIAGGLSGVWGPPVLFYLVALRLPPVEQVRAQGLTFFLGSCVLLGAHLNSGLLNRETMPLSAAMCVPVALGMAAGLRLQDRMDPVRFRRITLVVLCLAGLNLLRRGLI